MHCQIWKYALVLLANGISTLNPKQQAIPAVSGELIEYEVEDTQYHVADVLLLLDTSQSVGDNIEKLKSSSKKLISHFKIGDEHLRIAVAQCHGNHRTTSETDKILLYLKEGNSVDRVNEALDKLEVAYFNSFSICLRAALNKIFIKQNGDRSGVPNVIIFISDYQFSITAANNPTLGEFEESMKVIDTLKRNNVTIIAVAFCEDGCNGKNVANSQAASKEEYAVTMENFNANNKIIKNVLERTTSCKQKMDLQECKWTDPNSCQRNIEVDSEFSGEICQKNANKNHLMTDELVEKYKSCASVEPVTGDKVCYLNKKGRCTVREFKLKEREQNDLDKFRSADAVQKDSESCQINQTDGTTCPERACAASSCRNSSQLEGVCENVYILENCKEELIAKCRIEEGVDIHCYPFYYARNKTDFIEIENLNWSTSKPGVTVVTATVKELCENNTLRNVCGSWLRNQFNLTHFDICTKLGSKISSKCLKYPSLDTCAEDSNSSTTEKVCDRICDSNDLKTYIKCIREKMKLWKESFQEPYPCDKHMQTLNQLEKTTVTTAMVETSHPIADVTNHKSGPNTNAINAGTGANLGTTPMSTRNDKLNSAAGGSDKKSNSSMIIGIVVALILLALIVLIIAILLIRRKRSKKTSKRNVGATTKDSGAKSIGLAADLDLKSQMTSKLDQQSSRKSEKTTGTSVSRATTNKRASSKTPKTNKTSISKANTDKSASPKLQKSIKTQPKIKQKTVKTSKLVNKGGNSKNVRNLKK